MIALVPLTNAAHQRESFQPERRRSIASARNYAAPPRNYPEYLATLQQLESCAGHGRRIHWTRSGEQ